MSLCRLLYIFSLLFLVSTTVSAEEWRRIAIELKPDADPYEMASNMGAQYLGPLGALENTHLFSLSNDVSKLSSGPSAEVLSLPQKRERVKKLMASDARVVASYPLVPRKVHKRGIEVPEFGDPLFFKQWHLVNQPRNGPILGNDINVAPAWASGITGKGVTIAIVDDGLETTHPEFRDTYLAEGSYDFNFNRAGPTASLPDDTHSTAVAGIAMGRANNQLGGAGVAYAANVTNLRLLSADPDDADVVGALNHRMDINHVYNNSWGYGGGEDIVFIDPGTLVANALKQGAASGREGRGAIYVFASGNAGDIGSRADYDGLNNSPYTIAVGAVNRYFEAIGYAEGGSCLFVSAPSGDEEFGIVTADRTSSAGYSTEDFTFDFNGTSASCPVVSGVAALMLQARPELTWRDVQHILARTAFMPQTSGEFRATNSAGFTHDERYGFGVIDAGAAVALAREWPLVPQAITPKTYISNATNQIGFNTVELTLNVPDSFTLEHVQLVFNTDHNAWGDLDLELISPTGITSRFIRPHNGFNYRYNTWTFLSVRHWGENPQGNWRLRVRDVYTDADSGRLQGWRLILHGYNASQANNRPTATSTSSYAIEALPAEVDTASFVQDSNGDNVKLLDARWLNGGAAEIQSDGSVVVAKDDVRDARRLSLFYHDGKGGTLRRAIDVSVNTAVAYDDRFVVRAGQTAALNPALNDINASNIKIVSNATKGTAFVNANGTISYTPYDGVSGSDQFNYSVGNAENEGSFATVYITILEEKSKGAAYFSGYEHQVTIDLFNDNLLSGNFTMEAWIYAEDWGSFLDLGYGRIFDGDYFSFFINQPSGRLYNRRSFVFYMETGAGQSAFTSTSNVVTLGEWQHIAVSYNGAGEVKMHLNGTPLNVIRLSGNGFVNPSGNIFFSRNLRLGNSTVDGLRRPFYGKIADARLWNRVLTTEEIAQSLNELTLEPHTGLAGRWLAAEGFDYSAIDFSGNGRTGSFMPSTKGFLSDYPTWTYRIQPEERSLGVETFFTSITPTVDGLHFGEWLGYIWAEPFPFVYHFQHGWLYCVLPGGGEGFWAYSFADSDWWWTSATYYPFIYSVGSANWLYYVKDTGNPRIFYNLATNEELLK